MDRTSILAKRTITVEAVDVPEWERTVHVKSLSAIERVRFYDAIERIEESPERSTRIGMLLIVFSVCGEDLLPIFQEDDVDALCEQDGELMNRLCGVANRVNRIGAESAGEKKSGGKPVDREPALLDAAGLAERISALAPDAGSSCDHAGGAG